MAQAATQQPEQRWVYNQRTGQLRHPDGRLVQERGYSGRSGAQTTKEGMMKKRHLLIPVLTALFVFSGAAFCRATEQNPTQRTEDSLKIEAENKVVTRIRAGLLFSPTDQDLADFENGHWGFQATRAELARDKALKDIAANIPLLLLIRKDFGESFLDWVIPIAEKLPSQPVAVVQLATSIEDGYTGIGQRYIDHICPMMVIEDAIPFSRYKNWM